MGVALNFTAVAPVKPVPVMVTVVPMVPEVGLKEVSVGAGAGAVGTTSQTPRP